jgi:hypothetical protein
MPIGKPLLLAPAGTEMPQRPARFTGMVKMSDKYIWSGSASFSPNRNAAMQDLWDNELMGQISDGAWENKERHWESYSDAKSQVGDKTVLQNIPENHRHRFAFASELMDVIGDRMLERIRKHNPNYTEKDLRRMLIEINYGIVGDQK